MSKPKMTQLEILNETVKFYSENTQLRGMDSTSCVYNGTAKGSHCAVGRCMVAKYKKQGDSLNGNIGGINGLFTRQNKNTLDDILSLKYRGHSQRFWEAIQGLHDDSSNWELYSNGISERGKRKVSQIKAHIKENKKYNKLYNTI